MKNYKRCCKNLKIFLKHWKILKKLRNKYRKLKICWKIWKYFEKFLKKAFKENLGKLKKSFKKIWEYF